FLPARISGYYWLRIPRGATATPLAVDSLTPRTGAVPSRIASLLIVAFLLGQEVPARHWQFSANAAQAAENGAHWDIAFVCDGAGNYQMASKSLRSAVTNTGALLKVETFVWSHGYKKILPDQTDFE